jgi:osmotically-inducible protein OsmY
MMMMNATRSKAMTDSELRQAIQDELGWEPSIDDREIGVSVKEGVATLNGTVNNFFVKWEAGSAARRINGIMAVANDIEVQLPGDHHRNDTDVARKAAEALAWDVSLPADCVKVTVSDGWITLGGEVDWGYQKTAAETAVRRLLGVRGVTNGITVKPSAVPSNIKARIEAAFHRSAALDAQGIRVEAKGGQVTLHGNVRTWMERDEAERSAWGAQGITSVENLISLSPFGTY